MNPERFAAELVAQTGLLADAVRDLDPSAQVTTCPEWTVAQLVDHVGVGHRWVATMVERRVARPISKADLADDPVPADPDERTVWLVAGARRLADAVRETGPSTGMWTWSPDRTAGFWLRRITHDTLVHRADAELTAGRDVAIAADLAADGVTDLLQTFAVLPTIDDFPHLDELCANGETLHFHATDDGLGAAGEWFVRRGPDGLEFAHEHGKADVAVRGPAVHLLLTLTRRTPPDHVEVIGDAAIFTHWLSKAVF